MNNIGNVGANTNVNTTGQQSGEASSAQGASFQHSQFGAGEAQGLDNSFLEEAAMNIASSRKIKTKDSKKEKDILKKLLEESQKKVPDLPDGEKLNLCLKRLDRQMKSGNLNDDEIKKQLTQYSGDSTHQYLALEDLVKYLRSPGAEQNLELAEQLDTFAKTFYERERVDIQAGINVSVIAEEFSESASLGDTGQLRNIWRAALEVPEINSAIDAYQFAKDKAGGDYHKVGEGIEWMTKALSRELDLAQTEQSVEPARMLHVRRQLESVFGVNSAYEFCVNLEKQLERLIRSERGS